MRVAHVREKQSARIILLVNEGAECTVDINELLGALWLQIRDVQKNIADAFQVDDLPRIDLLIEIGDAHRREREPEQQREVAHEREEESSESRLLGALRKLGYNDEEAYAIIALAAEGLFGGTIPYPFDADSEKRLKEHLFARPNRITVENLVEFFAEATGRRATADESYDGFFTLLTELKRKLADYLRDHKRNQLLDRLMMKSEGGEKRRIEDDWFIADCYFVRHLISTKQI